MENQWELVLDNVLHSIRSLLCTATNETPHERLLSYPISNGYSLPTWPFQLGTVLVRKFLCESKSDSVVEPVDLISATSYYARILCPDERLASLPLAWNLESSLKKYSNTKTLL